MTLNRTHVRAALIGSLTLMLGACGDKDAERVVKDADGVIVTPKSGPAKQVRLVALSDRIVRVTAVPTEGFDIPVSLMVDTVKTGATSVNVETRDGVARMRTAELIAEVSLDTGLVTFKGLDGKPILTESKRSEFVPVKVDDKNFFAVQQQFNPGTEEGFYGLGQHQNAQMNYNGEDVELAQHNMDIAVPFVVSSNHYGVLWDNSSVTRFGNPKPYGLASRDLKITDADGNPGGFTAT